MSQTISYLGMDDIMASNVLASRDLFNVANRIAGRVAGQGENAQPLFDLRVLSQHGQPVRCEDGISLSAQGRWSDLHADDILILPAYMIADQSELEHHLPQWQEAMAFIRSIAAQQRLIVTNCSGSMLLAEAGVLSGHRATTAWWLHDLMASRHPKVDVEREAVCVLSGNMMTGSATTSCFDVTLAVIEQHGGAHLARLLSKYMMLDNQRRSQAPYAILGQHQASDDLVERAERWIRRNLGRDFRIEELASELHVSPRTLIRRFQKALGESPQSFTQKLRIEKSKILLETTQMRFGDIVTRCGYSDESAFRRLFKRYCQVSPREYRRRFAA
ncbi:AraC family transcriptional regulator [Spongiibacter nanhainus]|uniref:AraC family transcriptional regulator n=1 Tax=Spongiibacter nanhainus TaxID=2794344 RepID=A0A7T4QYE4_9GAMM|nr:helix-turn-helix domain-containing protein [Spongiibacter nanhainus]QQD17109.1 AraC family transcriptional regulator [Spongiibacter nanhainus]